MSSRREFLSTLAAGLAVSSLKPGRALGADAPEIKSSLNGPIGLQLYSLREDLPKDLPGTLAKVRAMGFREVEGAGLWKRTAPEVRAALDAAGLKCQSAHMGFERLRDDAFGAFLEAKVLGATGIVCPWIPHNGNTFTRDDAVKAAEAFNGFGKAAQEVGLTFGYHCHGYEFIPSAEGTLFDTIAGIADPKLVTFQIDVFHAYNGGADPAQLIEKHKGRVRSLHLKDLKKGTPVKAGSAGAEGDVDVPVGTGQIDYPAVLRAAKKAGVSMYYLEDESKDPLGHIPQSLAYLSSVKV
ncbi:MAG TPA: sugar phosphate isomerase/epimerase [Vicinamibacteria bacterium]|jgi:sugar phosphate isomerase/epimerase